MIQFWSLMIYFNQKNKKIHTLVNPNHSSTKYITFKKSYRYIKFLVLILLELILLVLKPLTFQHQYFQFILKTKLILFY
jgi:hypothetical protein